jgi:N-acetylglucosaminyldiphosphoundecaprenol N-acetyl-beta-D-mannosaminyltransferase
MPAALASAPDHTEPSQLFDLPIETEPPADLLRRIIGFTEGNERKRVAYVNAHVINQSFGIPEVRRALISSDVVYCDGYGVRLAAKAIGRPVPHRMTGADWIWGVAALCEAAGRSLYLLGSDPGASAEAAAELKRWYPSLRITGTHHGYFEQGSPHEQRSLDAVEDVARGDAVHAPRPRDAERDHTGAEQHEPVAEPRLGDRHRGSLVRRRRSSRTRWRKTGLPSR